MLASTYSSQELKNFLFFAKRSRINKLKSLLETSEDNLNFLINYRDSEGRTALHHASWSANEETIAYLIQKGFDPHAVDTHGQKPIHGAAYSKNMTALKYFIEQLRICPDIRDTEGRSPAFYAIFGNTTEVLKYLNEHGANLYIKDRYGQSLKDEAQKKDQKESRALLDCLSILEMTETVPPKIKSQEDLRLEDTLKRYLAFKVSASTNSIEKRQDDSLSTTSSNSHPSSIKQNTHSMQQETVQSLRIPLKPVISHTYSEETIKDLFYDAKTKPLKELVDLVKNHPAILTCRDKDGRNVLHHAAWGNLPENIEYLIKEGADPSAQDSNGRTPIHNAVSLENPSIFKIFIKFGTNVCAIDKEGRTAAHYAAWSGTKSFVRDLHKAGLDLNQPDIYGRTPLMEAAINNNHAFIKALYSYKLAKPYLQDDSLNTALHHAVANNHLLAFEELLNISILRSSSLSKAEENLLYTTFDLLNSNDMTAASIAAKLGYTKLVMRFINLRSNARPQKSSLIMWAATGKYIDVIETILKSSSHPQAALWQGDKKKQNIFHYASAYKQLELILFYFKELPQTEPIRVIDKSIFGGVLINNISALANLALGEGDFAKADPYKAFDTFIQIIYALSHGGILPCAVRELVKTYTQKLGNSILVQKALYKDPDDKIAVEVFRKTDKALREIVLERHNLAIKLLNGEKLSTPDLTKVKNFTELSFRLSLEKSTILDENIKLLLSKTHSAAKVVLDLLDPHKKFMSLDPDQKWKNLFLDIKPFEDNTQTEQYGDLIDKLRKHSPKEIIEEVNQLIYNSLTTNISQINNVLLAINYFFNQGGLDNSLECIFIYGNKEVFMFPNNKINLESEQTLADEMYFSILNTLDEIILSMQNIAKEHKNYNSKKDQDCLNSFIRVKEEINIKSWEINKCTKWLLHQLFQGINQTMQIISDDAKLSESPICSEIEVALINALPKLKSINISQTIQVIPSSDQVPEIINQALEPLAKLLADMDPTSPQLIPKSTILGETANMISIVEGFDSPYLEIAGAESESINEPN